MSSVIVNRVCGQCGASLPGGKLKWCGDRCRREHARSVRLAAGWVPPMAREPRVPFNVTAPLELAQWVQAEATRQGITRSRLICQILHAQQKAQQKVE